MRQACLGFTISAPRSETPVLQIDTCRSTVGGEHGRVWKAQWIDQKGFLLHRRGRAKRPFTTWHAAVRVGRQGRRGERGPIHQALVYPRQAATNKIALQNV